MTSFRAQRVAFFLWIALLAGGSTPAQTIRVEPPVRISPQDSGGHFWNMGNTHAAPDDPLSLITCGIRVRSNPLSWEGYLYATADGGLSWWPARIDTTRSDSGDPDMVSETSCGLGRHGNIYMNTSTWGRFSTLAFGLSHSSDGGHTWSEPLRRRGWYDATRGVVDNSGGRFDGHYYVFSNRLTKGAIAKFNGSYEPQLVTSDQGRSLQAADARRPGNEYVEEGWPSQAIVLKDGRVMAVHRVSFNGGSSGGTQTNGTGVSQQGLDIVTSSDGGRTLDAPVTVARWTRDDRAMLQDLTLAVGIADLVGAIAVDATGGAYRNRVYVAWRKPGDSPRIARIVLAWSENSGKTWSAPIRVDDAPNDDNAAISNKEKARGSDAMWPCLAVNKDGVVGLLWMERRAVPTWRFSASFDGGATFVPSIPVYTAQIANSYLRTSWFNYSMTAADYPTITNDVYKPEPEKLGLTLYTQAEDEASLAATNDGVFHAVWNTRDDGALWTSRIQIEGASRPKEGPSLAGLIDVSKRVRFQARNFSYDEASGRVLLDLVLVNISLGVPDREPPFAEGYAGNQPVAGIPLEILRSPLKAPMFVRITSLKCQAGELKLINSDGADSSGAPLLDWSTALPAGGLRPGERSAIRRLEFHLGNLKATPDLDVVRLLNLEAEAFSK
jgi:hypothetical protein